MHMLDMRQPFKPDDTSSELELRQIHAVNYIAARMGEIELHLGKIAQQLEATSLSAADVAKAIRDYDAPVRTMKK
jgi:hypothetical protein